VTGYTRWVQSLYYRAEDNYFLHHLTEYFVRESVNAEIGFPYVMLPVITAEEVLFNRAEALAMLNRNNEALSDLNLYASKRIANYNSGTHQLTLAKIRSFYNTNNTTTGLINTILDYKRAEFVQEGMRWFDMQRWGLPVTHVTAGATISLNADDPKRVLQLPQSVSLSGLPLNPR